VNVHWATIAWLAASFDWNAAHPQTLGRQLADNCQTPGSSLTVEAKGPRKAGGPLVTTRHLQTRVLRPKGVRAPERTGEG